MIVMRCSGFKRTLFVIFAVATIAACLSGAIVSLRLIELDPTFYLERETGAIDVPGFYPILVVGLLVFFGTAVIGILGSSRYIPKPVSIGILLIAFVMGCGVGLLASCAAIYHNPEEAYQDVETGALNILNLLPVFYSWFLPIFISIAIICLAAYWLAEVNAARAESRSRQSQHP